jgi:hypothetical protein
MSKVYWCADWRRLVAKTGVLGFLRLRFMSGFMIGFFCLIVWHIRLLDWSGGCWIGPELDLVRIKFSNEKISVLAFHLTGDEVHFFAC